ncbi:MAG TPA: PH domain-containing protein [Gemmataceae bacterium]|nr:PH domain-containing protein [Gemmataceae bacterium]
MVHPGKKDWWLAGLLAVISAAQLVGGGTLVGMAVVSREYPLLLPGGLLLLVGGLLLWILFGTSSEITETSLIIRSGPIRWRVPLDAIEEVVPSQGMGGPVFEWNLGLAVRGLRVRYRKKNGHLSWPIRIAPQDRAAFLLELSERLPGLEVKDDGSLRKPADHGVTG